jgi:NAD dependent epimerase/dehydratase family enzyme
VLTGAVRIFLTGGTGYIGTALAGVLREHGHDMRRELGYAPRDLETAVRLTVEADRSSG